MLRNKYILIVMILALSSCVKIYSPNIKGSDANKYVVSGGVTAGAETQTVHVSMTSSINDPTYQPVTRCTVAIRDNQNNTFPMVDMGNGDYSTLVNPKYLVPGHVFMVSVVTPGGDSIISDYDTLQQVPAVDSIHYAIKKVESQTGLSTEGLQFYIDLNGTNADSRYYRWVIYETWEYHALYPLEFYWDGKMNQIWPPDSSKYTCWDTRRIPEIFTLSTVGLSENAYSRLPLQYVDNTSPKLENGYSMLVEQLSLSQEAYNYWDKLRTNSTESSGLYETQPISIVGNMHDLTHPSQKVLGFFGASSVTYKRIFVGKIPGLTFNYIAGCSFVNLRSAGYTAIPVSDYPAYIKAIKDKPSLIWLNHGCVNCTLQGGTTVKPSFWPK